MATGLKYEIDENNYIIGWGTTDTANEIVEYPWPEMYPIGALYDEFHNPIYKLVDGKIVKEPQQPTAEQLESKRKQNIVQDIRKTLTIDDEIALVNKAIKAIINQEEIPQEYVDYRTNVEEIKTSITNKLNQV